MQTNIGIGQQARGPFSIAELRTKRRQFSLSQKLKFTLANTWNTGRIRRGAGLFDTWNRSAFSGIDLLQQLLHPHWKSLPVYSDGPDYIYLSSVWAPTILPTLRKYWLLYVQQFILICIFNEFKNGWTIFHFFLNKKLTKSTSLTFSLIFFLIMEKLYWIYGANGFARFLSRCIKIGIVWSNIKIKSCLRKQPLFSNEK